MLYRSNVDDRLHEDDCQFNNPCTIRNLDQLHSYAFQVRAVNVKGHSGLSNTLTAMTIIDFSRIPDAKQVRIVFVLFVCLFVCLFFAVLLFFFGKSVNRSK